MGRLQVWWDWIRRKQEQPNEDTHDWVISRSKWTLGKPTYLFLLEVSPAPHEDVVTMANTSGFVSKGELFEFVEDQQSPFFRKELPEGMMWRGRIFTAYVPPDGEQDVEEDVSGPRIGPRRDSGASDGTNEEVRAQS